MAPRIQPTTDQALAGARAGHRMAGMEPTPTDLAIGRQYLDGELSIEEALEVVRANHQAKYGH